MILKNTKDVGKDVGKELDETKKEILKNITKNPTVTIPELANEMKVSERTIERHLATLKKKNYILRSGSRKEGYWELIRHD